MAAAPQTPAMTFMVPPGTEPNLNGPRSPRMQLANGGRFGFQTSGIHSITPSNSKPIPRIVAPHLDLTTVNRSIRGVASPVIDKSSTPVHKSNRQGINAPQVDNRQTSPVIDPSLSQHHSRSRQRPALNSPSLNSQHQRQSQTQGPHASDDDDRATDIIDEKDVKPSDHYRLAFERANAAELREREFLQDPEEFGPGLEDDNDYPQDYTWPDDDDANNEQEDNGMIIGVFSLLNVALLAYFFPSIQS